MTGLAVFLLQIRYCVKHWPVDALLAEAILHRVRYAVPVMIVTAAITLALLWAGTRGAAFGIVPTLNLRLDLSHLIALVAGLLAVVIFLDLQGDPFTVWVVAVLLVGTASLVVTEAPDHLRAAWIFPMGLWILPLLFFCFSVLPAEERRPQEVWIRNIFLRGASTTPLGEVRLVSRKRCFVSPEAPILFGFEWFPIEDSTGHFLIAGSSGSGKTILFRLMMQSILPRIVAGSKQRAVILDAKHDVVAQLAGMGLQDRTLNLNPFDARCAVWDMARDIRTPSDSLALARLFLPEGEADKDPFWFNSARGLLSDIILAHILALQKKRLPHWSLADIVRSLQSKDEIHAALALDESTQDALRNIHEEKTLHGVLSTLDLVRREFEVLAALWDEPSTDPERLFSLGDWMQAEGILVLAPTATAEAIITPLNRLVLDRIAQLLLDGPEVPPTGGANPSRTWLFLDEFQRLGQVPRMESLMTNGRSKGVIAVLGFQEISDLRHIYRPEIAVTLTGSCTHKVLLHAPSPEHATWCEEVIGAEQAVQLAKGVSSQMGPGQPSTSIGWSASEKIRPLFIKDEFRILGKPGERIPVRLPPSCLFRALPRVLHGPARRFYETSLFSPIRGICTVTGRIFRSEFPFGEAIWALVPPVGEAFVPRPKRDQFLQTWSRKPAAAVPLGANGKPTPDQAAVPPDPAPRIKSPAASITKALWNIVRPDTKPKPTP